MEKRSVIRSINVTFGNDILHALIDDEDYERVSKHSWCASETRDSFRAETRINTKSIRLHRFIMNAPEGSYVDHINHNQLDNRKSNLRLCTNQENTFNTRIPKSNTSGYKGVSKYKDKWRAYISHNYKQIHLGLYETKELAANAYNKKAKELFGKYAKLNSMGEAFESPEQGKERNL